jgi:predicted nucleic acid-binding Zn ribbon protein
MSEFVYKCWKCRYRRLIHQRGKDEQELYCPRCGRKLMQTNPVHGLVTDTTFMIGSHVNDGFGGDERTRKLARARAKELGVSVAGKRFCPGLVDSEGNDPYDPRAWVSSRADVQNRCVEKGWGCKGSINVTPRKSDTEPEPYQCNPNFVEEEIAEIQDEHGPLSAKETAELRENLTAKFSGED